MNWRTYAHPFGKDRFSGLNGVIWGILVTLLLITVKSNYDFTAAYYPQASPVFLILKTVFMWLLLIILYPLFRFFANRIIITSLGKDWYKFLFHVVISMGLMVFASIMLRIMTGLWFQDLTGFIVETRREMVNSGGMVLLLYWFVIALEFLEENFRKLESVIEDKNQLVRQLNVANVQRLDAQLRPHFLYNTLSMISSNLYTSPERAVILLEKLKNLFQKSFVYQETQLIPLKEELEFTTDYLDLEQNRFIDSLQVVYEVDNSLGEFPVPNMILQPLVENAIKHGLVKMESKGVIRITIQKSSRHIVLSVEDNGPGFSSMCPGNTDEVPLGIGLTNIRDRLVTLYGPDAELIIGSSELGGAKMGIKLPATSALYHDENITGRR